VFDSVIITLELEFELDGLLETFEAPRMISLEQIHVHISLL